MEKQVKDAVQAWTEIEEAANEAAVNSPRVVHKMEVGQVVRQGDIYIHRVETTHKHGGKAETQQLALGQTMGSRHVAEAPAKVFTGLERPSWCDARTFLGPCVESEERFTVSHPEHAHVELPPGCYQVTHQMDARSMERVQD